MAWIPMVPEDDASGDLQELYEKYRHPTEGVDNILRIHSLAPASMTHHHDLYRNLMYGRSGLSRAQREMIAVVVSAVNECHY